MWVKTRRMPHALMQMKLLKTQHSQTIIDIRFLGAAGTDTGGNYRVSAGLRIQERFRWRCEVPAFLESVELQ